jgi:hypothetical protein
MLLTLKPLWRDHDGMLELRFSIEGSGYAAEVTFYCYPETIEAFGRIVSANAPGGDIRRSHEAKSGHFRLLDIGG